MNRHPEIDTEKHLAAYVGKVFFADGVGQVRWMMGGRSRWFRSARPWSPSTPTEPSSSRRRRRVTVIGATALFLFAVTTLAADALLRPSLHAWATTTAVKVATTAIANATLDYTLPSVDSSELFQAITDGEGQIVLIDYNMQQLNQLRAQTARRIQESLTSQTHEDLFVPLGLLTGVDFLAGFGPRMKVRIVPVGAVTTLPRSDFTANGINMINHRVYVYTRIVIKVVAPYIDVEVPVEQDIVLTNQIIPGKVPNVFVGIEGLDLGSLLDGQFALPGNR